MTGIVDQFGNLERMLDAAAMRHRVIAQNIANVNTPGYTRQEVDFETRMIEALKEARGSSVSVSPEIVTDTASPARADGNNVDIDKEIGEMTRTSLLYETYLQLMVGRLSTMHHAIRG